MAISAWKGQPTFPRGRERRTEQFLGNRRAKADSWRHLAFNCSVWGRRLDRVGLAAAYNLERPHLPPPVGIAVCNGGDDFEWMDSLRIYSKGRATRKANETSVPRVSGDALLVSKSEAASALIYWNGKRYAWLQQGD
jgi:hypothetical protein